MADREGEDDLLAFHLAHSSLAALELDADFRVVRWSPQAEALFGWKEHEVLGRHPEEVGFIHPEDEPLVQARLRELLKHKGGSNRVLNRNLDRHGNVLHCEWHNTVRYDENGQLKSLFSLAADITEQVERERELERANDQLRSQEQLLRMASRLARLGAWSWDREARQARWSDHLYSILEIPPGTAIEDGGLKYIAPEYHEPLRDAFFHCLHEGAPFDTELVAITQTGRHIDARLTGEAETDERGRIQAVQGAFQDIMEQKERERKVRELANHLSRTLESITDAFLMLDRQWRFTYVNQEAERIMGYSAETLLGTSLWEKYPDLLETHAREHYYHAMENGEAQSFEIYYHPLQSWLEVRIYPFSDGLSVYFQDITERKVREERLSEQAQLLENARDAIVVRDVHHRIRFWNRSAERLYGWHRSEVLGRSAEELLYNDAGTFREASRQVLEKGEWRGRMEQLRRDGSPITIEGHWTLVRGEQGEPESILAINTDITGRLSLEEQLRQSQRLEAVGQLTGGVAHDFNNLLTIILGSADFLAGEVAGEENRELVNMIRQAAQRGADLTRRLLTVARRQALEPRAVDINEMLEELRPLLERSLAENVVLDLRTATGLHASFLDPSELEAALLNLAINARDAMPRGGTITIETRNIRLGPEYTEPTPDLAPGEYVMVSVADTGEGISREYMDRILDPFFTTKEEGKGTGLGLSMVYGFVKQSGGHLEIGSAPGQGTVINLFFPASDKTACPEVEMPDLTVEALGGPEKILLVDDDPLVLHHTRRQLQEFGYNVVVACDGPEALATLEEQLDIDLLLSDVVMPGGMYGHEVARRARELQPGMAVLLVSGYTPEQHEDLQGEFPLLMKPWQKGELARMVREALSGSILNASE